MLANCNEDGTFLKISSEIKLPLAAKYIMIKENNFVSAQFFYVEWSLARSKFGQTIMQREHTAILCLVTVLLLLLTYCYDNAP